MSRVLGVGIATLDIINTVAEFPPEDAEVRALAQRITRGGNAANTLVVLSQLGHTAALAAVLSDEPGAELVRADLQRHGVDLSPCITVAGGHLPTSYITLNQHNGSRTIVHFRDLPEYAAADFARVPLAGYDWIHFEGRNVEALDAMLAQATSSAGARVSLEVEKPRAGIEALFTRPQVLLFARAYAQARGHKDPRGFLAWARAAAPQALIFLGWGAQGAYADIEGDVIHVPAAPPPRVVDTVGAGDVLNAGLIDALLRGEQPAAALQAAVRLAGRSCGQLGLDALST